MINRSTPLTRRLAAAACAAVLVAGCSGGSDDSSEDTVADTAADTVADTTAETVADTVADTVAETVADTTAETVADTAPETTEATTPDTEAAETTEAATSEPTDATPTEGGSELAFGDTAVVAIDDELPAELIGLTVTGIRAGTSEELAQLQIEDVAPDAQFFYVDYTLENVSAPEEGADYTPSPTVQFVALDADDTPLAPIIKLTAFEACENDIIDELAVGESIDQCEIYLAEGGAVAESVGFASGFDSLPIFWR